MQSCPLKPPVSWNTGRVAPGITDHEHEEVLSFTCPLCCPSALPFVQFGLFSLFRTENMSLKTICCTIHPFIIPSTFSPIIRADSDSLCFIVYQGWQRKSYLDLLGKNKQAKNIQNPPLHSSIQSSHHPSINEYSNKNAICR